MRKTLDDLIKLDISFLHKKGKLKHGISTELAWTLDKKLLFATVVFAADNHIIMSDKKILLTETKCNYGGIRKWFNCPSCSRRVRVLFGRDFKCRTCLKLKYKCQYETDSARMKRKLDNFRQVRPYLSRGNKPKFMHRKTFYGNKVRFARLEIEYNLMLSKN